MRNLPIADQEERTGRYQKLLGKRGVFESVVLEERSFLLAPYRQIDLSRSHHPLPRVAKTTLLALRLMTQVQALGQPQRDQRKVGRSTNGVKVRQLVPAKCLADLRLVTHGSLEITAAHCCPFP